MYMVWNILLEPRASKQLGKLSPYLRESLSKFMSTLEENPRCRGGMFTGALKPLWRYRWQNMRIVCRMEDEVHTVKVIAIGHRREVYNDAVLMHSRF